MEATYSFSYLTFFPAGEKKKKVSVTMNILKESYFPSVWQYDMEKVEANVDEHMLELHFIL